MLFFASDGANSLLTRAVDHLPHIFLVLLVFFILILTFKDVINGVRKPFLNPTTWQRLQLVDKKTLTHNTRRFRFALPHQDQKLGLPVGQHISIKTTLPDGSVVMRPYTPTSEGNARGYVDFVIKVYPDGKMSQAMDKLEIGDSMEFKGPKGRFKFDDMVKRKIGMIAGGTGITPMFQVANAILKDTNNTTEISLIFGNVSEDDMLLKEELEDLAMRYPDKFSVYHVLDKPPSGWKGGKGFVTADMIRYAYILCLSCLLDCLIYALLIYCLHERY